MKNQVEGCLLKSGPKASKKQHLLNIVNNFGVTKVNMTPKLFHLNSR